MGSCLQCQPTTKVTPHPANQCRRWQAQVDLYLTSFAANTIAKFCDKTKFSPRDPAEYALPQITTDMTVSSHPICHNPKQERRSAKAFVIFVPSPIEFL